MSFCTLNTCLATPLSTKFKSTAYGCSTPTRHVPVSNTCKKPIARSPNAVGAWPTAIGRNTFAYLKMVSLILAMLSLCLEIGED